MSNLIHGPLAPSVNIAELPLTNPRIVPTDIPLLME
jgi:hypothetical protein